MSSTGVALLKQFEGLRLKAYLCSANVPTIGYGHTKGVKLGDVITQDQADQYLREDLIPCETAVLAKVPGLTQCQFDALVSFVFNLGVGAFSKSTLLKLIKTNPHDPGITAQFLRWNKAGGKVVKGLTDRRTEEANLYRGLYESGEAVSMTLKRVEPSVKL
jgi:lysozyme